MKLHFYFLIAFVMTSFSVMAQQDVEGEVKLYQDEAIKNLIGSPRKDSTINHNNPDSTYEGDGEVHKNAPIDGRKGNYRIQVFSGNQKDSKKEAMSKRSLVKERFPSMVVDVQYESPIWKVRAGYFTNNADAQAALYELKNAFPAFGREMYVIRVAQKK
ncbi:SPOR domain-containing protein [Dysgonomonas sp. 520]|uniref:SPOR domain-containing protein n=1 Tax=Dysgonomonas sp. 520 TaxID=2302931 RepID=UPI0013D1A70B|nr:SPOR domain-containing protein [Dysgonomonas sp. 520]NDW08191.1 SPOR domain-containing protein [Dysgonomonas sp. 520]